MIELTIVGIVIFVFVNIYRKRSSSGKIIVKVICSILLVGFTFAMIGTAYDYYETYQYRAETSKLEYRLDQVQKSYAKNGVRDLADDMYYDRDFESDFDQYWQELIDNHKANVEKMAATDNQGAR